MKSKIIKQLVNNEISLTQALTHLQTLAHDLNNKDLESWAKKEKVGYSTSDKLPKYRQTESFYFTYSGFNGRYEVKNAPLPVGFLSEETLNKIGKLEFPQSVRALEEYLIGESQNVTIDRSIYAIEVVERSNDGITPLTLGQILPKSFFYNALEQIKNKTLESLLRLEDEFGVLDDLNIDVSNRPRAYVEQFNKDMNTTINIITPATQKESAHNKIFWHILIPIVTATLAGLGTYFLTKYLGG